MHQFLCVLSVAVARFSSDGVANMAASRPVERRHFDVILSKLTAAILAAAMFVGGSYDGFNFFFFRLLIQSTKRNCTRRTAIAEATRYNSPYLHTIAFKYKQFGMLWLE